MCQIVAIIEAAEKHSSSHPRDVSHTAQRVHLHGLCLIWSAGCDAVVVWGPHVHLDNYQWSRVVLPVTVASCYALFKRTQTNWPELKGKLRIGLYSYLITLYLNVTVGFWGEAWSLTYLIWTREDQAPSTHTGGGLWKVTLLINHAILSQLFWHCLNFRIYPFIIIPNTPYKTYQDHHQVVISMIMEGWLLLAFCFKVQPFNTVCF